MRTPFTPARDSVARRRLLALCDERQFSEAAGLCLQAIGTDTREYDAYWRLQLGLVYFLDEMNPENYFNLSFDTLAQLSDDYRDFSDVYLWSGYVALICRHDEERFRRDLETSLSLDYSHPYANLLLSSHTQQMGRPEVMLKILLEEQP